MSDKYERRNPSTSSSLNTWPGRFPRLLKIASSVSVWVVAPEDVEAWTAAGPTTEGSPEAGPDEEVTGTSPLGKGGDGAFNKPPTSCSTGGTAGSSITSSDEVSCSPSIDCCGVSSEGPEVEDDSELASEELDSDPPELSI